MATNTESQSGSGAAAQRADTQALAELNQRSAGLGQWDVSVYNPAKHEWKYTPKGTGQAKTGAAFRCILVSLLDHSQYVSAHLVMRSDNMVPLQQAGAKFKAGLKFRISKVVFDSLSKQEFLRTPLKHRVDLAKTKTDPLMQLKQGEMVQPAPAMNIKDCKTLQQTQRFDVTALMDAMSEVRSVSFFTSGCLSRNHR